MWPNACSQRATHQPYWHHCHSEYKNDRLVYDRSVLSAASECVRLTLISRLWTIVLTNHGTSPLPLRRKNRKVLCLGIVMVATEAGEKERVASWSVQGETILDMYAGMGCPSRQQYNWLALLTLERLLRRMVIGPFMWQWPRPHTRESAQLRGSWSFLAWSFLNVALLCVMLGGLEAGSSKQSWFV